MKYWFGLQKQWLKFWMFKGDIIEINMFTAWMYILKIRGIAFSLEDGTLFKVSEATVVLENVFWLTNFGTNKRLWNLWFDLVEIIHLHAFIFFLDVLFHQLFNFISLFFSFFTLLPYLNLYSDLCLSIFSEYSQIILGYWLLLHGVTIQSRGGWSSEP